MKHRLAKYFDFFFHRRSSGPRAGAVTESLNQEDRSSRENDDSVEKRAASGSPVDQNSLGLMFAFGDGPLKNIGEARKWFRRAADQGDAAAQFNLGNLCHPANLGRHHGAVEEARIEAYMWFYLASVQGHNKAEASCEMLNLQMTDAELRESQRRAIVFQAKKEPQPA